MRSLDPFLNVAATFNCLVQPLQAVDLATLIALLALAGVALFAIILLKRTASAPGKKLDKWLAEVALAKSIPDSEVPKFDQTISFTEHGFSVADSKRPAQHLEECSWDEVQQIKALKRDLWTTDCICLVIELQNGTALELHEEMNGWTRFCKGLPEHLTGALSFESWMDSVSSPAFELCLTHVYERHKAAPVAS
jgi:hypothetical protein